MTFHAKDKAIIIGISSFSLSPFSLSQFQIIGNVFNTQLQSNLSNWGETKSEQLSRQIISRILQSKFVLHFVMNLLLKSHLELKHFVTCELDFMIEKVSVLFSISLYFLHCIPKRFFGLPMGSIFEGHRNKSITINVAWK